MLVRKTSQERLFDHDLFETVGRFVKEMTELQIENSTVIDCKQILIYQCCEQMEQVTDVKKRHWTLNNLIITDSCHMYPTISLISL